MSNLFSPPKPPPSAIMPDPNDPLALLKQKQKQAQQAATQGGRQSTIFSSGGDYSSKSL